MGQLYSWEDILAETHEYGIVTIVGNGPSVVKNHAGKSQFVGIPEAQKETIVAHTTDFSTYPHPIWVINGAQFYHPDKASLSWHMDDFRGDNVYDHPQPEWYMNLHRGEEGCPIMTSTEIPDMPRTVAFPLKECLLSTKDAYFCECIQYMLAFAYMAEVKEVSMYGCDYMTHDRQPAQRACTEFWLGRLREQGVVVRVSPHSNLMKCPKIEPYKTGFYGYLDNEDLPVDLEEVNKKIAEGETWRIQDILT